MQLYPKTGADSLALGSLVHVVKVLLYDIRYPHPLLVHGGGSALK